MAFKATHDVVQRVMPLLEQMATRTIDKARLLQFLSASAGVDWGIMTVISDEHSPEGRIITYRDELSGANYQLRYPEFLSDDLAALVLAEYKRLAVDKPLTKMDKTLFDYFFTLTHCARCRYRGAEHAQIHSECHFAGFPINFEPE